MQDMQVFEDIKRRHAQEDSSEPPIFYLYVLRILLFNTEQLCPKGGLVLCS